MLSRVTRRAWMWCLAFPAALTLAGEAARPALVALPDPVAPSAEVRAAAAKAGLSLGPLTLVLDPGTARVGDSVVALITLSNGAAQKQWLVQFEIDTLNDAEKKNAGQFNVHVGSTASGQSLDFSSKPTFALKIHALGPFALLPYNPKTAAKSAVDKTARSLVMPDFLSIGLDRASRVMLDHGVSTAATAIATIPKLSGEEEKAVLGGFVALLQFFMTAQQTPGLKEIVWEIIDLPSVWSLARGLGKINPGFDFGVVPLAALDPARWGLGAIPLYRYPFGITLNEKPAVHCALFVTAPNPPLLTTAGILGFTAESPSHKDKRMLVQIVSAYRGKEAIAATRTLLQNATLLPSDLP